VGFSNKYFNSPHHPNCPSIQSTQTANPISKSGIMGMLFDIFQTSHQILLSNKVLIRLWQEGFISATEKVISPLKV